MSDKLYLIICGQHIDQYAPERELKDMTWAGTVKDLADLQFPSMVKVIEIGTDKDVTKTIAREVMTIWTHQGEPLTHSQYSFVEDHIGTRASRSFLRAA